MACGYGWTTTWRTHALIRASTGRRAGQEHARTWLVWACGAETIMRMHMNMFRIAEMHMSRLTRYVLRVMLDIKWNVLYCVMHVMCHARTCDDPCCCNMWCDA